MFGHHFEFWCTAHCLSNLSSNSSLVCAERGTPRTSHSRDDCLFQRLLWRLSLLWRNDDNNRFSTFTSERRSSSCCKRDGRNLHACKSCTSSCRHSFCVFFLSYMCSTQIGENVPQQGRDAADNYPLLINFEERVEKKI